MKTLFFTLLVMTTSLTADPLLERASLANFDQLISEEAIQTKIKETAQIVNRDLKEAGIDHITLVVLMKGGICIGSDFMRHLDLNTNLECVRTSSYGMRGMERGHLTIEGLNQTNLEGKDILLIDDIFDTGCTLSGVVAEIEKCNPNSLRSLILLNKDVPKKTSYRPDYTLFDIPNLFVVGYGMDYKECWRDLPHVYVVR